MTWIDVAMTGILLYFGFGAVAFVTVAILMYMMFKKF